MTRVVLAVLLCAPLLGCGADGPPIPPEEEPGRSTGLTVGGEARIGVIGGIN